MKKEKDRALVKNTGQVFTPDYIVDGMLDFCGYTGKAILGKHVIDNSCGDGAFLRPILRRYIEEALSCGIGRAGLKADLETYIHGIDIDPVAYSACLEHLSGIAAEYGITGVRWDLMNENSLKKKVAMPLDKELLLRDNRVHK